MTTSATPLTFDTDSERRLSFRSAVLLSAWMGILKFLIHLITNIWQVHLGYSYHRDELYYLICGQRLGWGYVDHGPLVAWQARLALAVFGKSVVGVRMLSALAGAIAVSLTGILTWALGGRRIAQSLAMTCVLVAPTYLALDSFLSMNSVEPVFWLGFLLVLLCMQRGAPPWLWMAAGLLAGFGLLNKPSMVFFVAALLAALLLTPERRILHTRYFPLAVLLTLACVSPYLLWQYHHGWPTWVWLHEAQEHGKYLPFDYVDFLLAPEHLLLPITLPIWLGGLVWLLIDPHKTGKRWLGIAFLLFFALMATLKAKDYYLIPAYPLLLAAGGICWEWIFSQRLISRYKIAAFTIFELSATIWCLILLPLSIPIIPPSQWTHYLNLADQSTGPAENFKVALLPQFYADRFGWEQLAQEMRRIVTTLPPEERSQIGILCDNYGEASAINFFDGNAGFPVAISGHNTYYLWGDSGYTGNDLILVTAQTPAELSTTYKFVQAIGHMDAPLSMPYEHKTIYLVHGRIRSLTADWPHYRLYL